MENVLSSKNVYFTIDPESRVIDIPKGFSVVGVESDKESKRIVFKAPKIVGNDFDLSAADIVINYINANGEVDQNNVENIVVDVDIVTFDWIPTEKVTRYEGNVNFVVSASVSSAGLITNRWNTTIAKVQCLDGIEVHVTPDEEEKARDILQQLVDEATNQINKKTAEALASIPDDYTQIQEDINLLSDEITNLNENAIEYNENVDYLVENNVWKKEIIKKYIQGMFAVESQKITFGDSKVYVRSEYIDITQYDVGTEFTLIVPEGFKAIVYQIDSNTGTYSDGTNMGGYKTENYDFVRLVGKNYILMEVAKVDNSEITPESCPVKIYTKIKPGFIEEIENITNKAKESASGKYWKTSEDGASFSDLTGDEVTEAIGFFPANKKDLNDFKNNFEEKVTDKNLFDENTAKDGYINEAGELVTGVFDWKTSNLILTEPGAQYCLSAVTSPGGNDRGRIKFFFLNGYDDKGNFKNQLGVTVDSPYTIPDGVYGITFSYHSDSYYDLQLEKGYTFTDFEPFKKTLLIKNSEYVEKQNTNLFPFLSKRWAVFGDSLTEKNYRAKYSYYDYISEELGIKIVNYGVGGTGYKKGEDNANAFYQRMQNINPDDFDFLTIFGSQNDGDITIGTPTDTGTDTIGGCVNTTIDKFYEIAPFKPIGIVAPCPWFNSNPDGSGNTSEYMEQYTDLLQSICKIRGIPFMDLRHESGLRPWDAKFREEYYVEPNEDETGVYEDNGTHPNSKGHRVFLYPKFREFVKKLI